MNNNPLLKTAAGTTGKEIIQLRAKPGQPGTAGRRPPLEEMERTLYGMWQELLGRDDIGIDDDFFASGGNSLKATQLVSRITRQLRIAVQLEDIFHHPTIAAQCGLVGSRNVRANEVRIEQQPRTEKLPLSFSQEGLWVIDRLHGSTHYHLAAVLRFTGGLNAGTLAVALGKIVERHEVLRTVIREDSGRPYQWIKPAGLWGMRYRKDGSLRSGDMLDRFVQELITKPFDLAKDDMVRADLLELSPQEYILILVVHHIAADGWSLPLFAGELAELYNAREEHREPVLAGLPVQYADFAAWQRRYFSEERLAQQLSYWKRQLADTRVLTLPADHPRPTVQGIGGRCSYFDIGYDVLAGLQRLSDQSGATLFMTLLSAFYLLLFRYSGEEDICVGSPSGNRSLPETEALIGFFVNTLVLRARLRQNMRFSELVQEVKRTTVEAYMHQEVPFEKVVEQVAGPRGLQRTPLFQVVFLLQNTPEIPPMKLGDVRMTIEPVQQTAVQFELEFSLREMPQGLQLRVEYSHEIYNEATITRMSGHYIEILRSVSTDPSVTLRGCRMLSIQEEQFLLGQSGG